MLKELKEKLTDFALEEKFTIIRDNVLSEDYLITKTPKPTRRKRMKTKTKLTQINALKSVMNVYLVDSDDFLTSEDVREMINRVIVGHCAVIGKPREEFLKQNPFIENELSKFVWERKFVTTRDGTLLSQEDDETIEERKRKIAELKKAEMWKHWSAYVEFLKIDKNRAENIIANLDEVTDTILAHLPNPNETAKFFISGLVVGFVQSGKTENYSALINKAIDLGYEIVIILAGVPSLLRNQTQFRAETDIIGIDSHTYQKIGIGHYMDGEPSIEMFTKQDKNEPAGTKNHNGDFSKERIRMLPSFRGNKKILLVVKKNADVLEYLREWLEDLAGKGRGRNDDKPKQNILRNKSLLIINDESDHASINLEKPNEEPSKIAREITNILNLFDKKAIVGYTATPFANIFLDPTEKVSLFPKDFIYLLEPPSDYLGPFEFFGVNYKGETIPAMPLVVTADTIDALSFVDEASIHEWDYKQFGVNPSLRQAIDSFILSGAIRRLRGQKDEHHSMLIHISVSQTSHKEVQEAVQKYIDDIQKCSLPGFPCLDFWKRIEDLYTDNFLTTSEKMEKIDTAIMGHKVQYPIQYSMPNIKKEVMEFLNELEKVYKINGEKDSDFLDFKGFEESHGRGMKVICVGGSMLSRGFTVEGLSCSYYARNSLQCDTILQCGRFFGYRPGYRDLVRVYTTEENEKMLRLSAVAVFELTQQFKKMERENKKPDHFGFYVTEMMQGYLKPTSQKRMRKFEPVDTSFSGYTSEVASFILDDTVSKHNQDITIDFLEALGTPTPLALSKGDTSPNEQYSWRYVDSLAVLEYISNLKISKYSRFHEVSLLRDYIKELRNVHRQLFRFDVVLPNLARGGRTVNLGKYEVKSANRKAILVPNDPQYYIVNEGRALTGRHLEYGLTEKEIEQLYKRHPLNKKSDVQKLEDIRPFRAKRGQLIIYTFSPDRINTDLGLTGSNRINEAPVGFHFNLPECDAYENRKSLVNLVYYLNEVLGGNVI